jgi:O-methyltransferase
MPISEPSSDSFLGILRAERRDLLDRLRQTRFSTLKEGYTQAQIIPYASYSPWLDDEPFLALYQHVKDCTLVDIYRCYELYLLARQMRSVQGDIVEIGVWRGGTAALMAAAARDKPIHLFDTFTGVAKADKNYDTLYSGGEHADTERNLVDRLFESMDLRCTVSVGIFPEDTGSALPASICLAHIDVDTYASARDAFLAIWPSVRVNGVVVFDDYGFFGCEGVAQVVNEINTNINDALFVYNVNGHALMIKQGSMASGPG